MTKVTGKETEGKVEHSPLPWTNAGQWPYERECMGAELGATSIQSADRICPVLVWGGIQETSANAEFICRAVNSHYDLLAALKAHDAYMSEQFSGPDSDALHPKAAGNWARVRAAINAAEGR